MTLPYRWPDRFVVPSRKISHYLLDKASPDGRSKAEYLTSYGFDPAHPEILESALVAHANSELFSKIVPVTAGVKYIFEGVMPAPYGNAWMRTVWQLEDGTADARFITGVPGRRSHGE